MNIGFAICGSFCTFSSIFPVIELLVRDYQVTPILSECAAKTNTRFGKASDHIDILKELCGQPPLVSIPEVEPIGPTKMFDALIIAPATGNSIAKLANAISDGPVTMAAKSHLRNGRPLLLAISSNDALSGSAENIGKLLSKKHIFFVPFGQDDPKNKPTSMVADFNMIPQALSYALKNQQIQPLIIEHK